MKRAVVIGCPGSGTSVFSRKLTEITGLPLVHLDNLYWRDDATTLDREAFLSKLCLVLEEEAWIIDGNYLSTMEMRISHADTVFFFDLPSETCIDGIRERVGKKRDDIPWIEQGIDEEFLHFVENFNTQTRPKIIDILSQNKDKRIICFESREQSEEYLYSIKNELI